MNIKEFLKSKVFNKIALAVLLLIIIFLSFGLGVFVGFRKAQFSYRWSERYKNEFGHPRRRPFDFFSTYGFQNSSGVLGQIIAIGSSTITLRDNSNQEKYLLISSSTVIKAGHETISASLLQTNSTIVAIGSPDQSGQIQTKLIKVLP